MTGVVIIAASPAEARHLKRTHDYGPAFGYAEPVYDYGYATIYGPHCHVESGFIKDAYGGQIARIRFCD